MLTQPPVYTGPPRRPAIAAAPRSDAAVLPIPGVADFLSRRRAIQLRAGSADSEVEFKQAYAKVATAAGLTREQTVRIYAFETGGNGTYDAQAGMSATARTRGRSRRRSATTSSRHQHGELCSPGTATSSSRR